MTKSKENQRWWRFSRYELRQGYKGAWSIVATRDAELESFDPWAEFQAAVGNYSKGLDKKEAPGQARSEKERPYQSLLKLVLDLEKLDGKLNRLLGQTAHTQTELQTFEGKRSEILEEQAKLVLNWCREHGLLGILPHRLLAMSNHPLGVITTGREGDPVLALGGVAWERTSRGWAEADGGQARLRFRRDDADLGWLKEHFPPEDCAPRLVSTAALSSLRSEEHQTELRRSRIEPGARLGRLPLLASPASTESAMTFEDMTTESITFSDETWAQFFPDIPSGERETYEYPEPPSADFWRAYGEPLDLFLDVARSFSTMLNLQLTNDLGLPGKRAGIRVLNSMAGAAHLAFQPDEERLRQDWWFPSQLAAFAVMLGQDLAQNRFVLCENCGIWFPSNAYQVRHCSDHCRWAAQKRRQRSRGGERA